MSRKLLALACLFVLGPLALLLSWRIAAVRKAKLPNEEQEAYQWFDTLGFPDASV